MKMKTHLLAAAVIGSVGLSGCGSDSDSSPSAGSGSQNIDTIVINRVDSKTGFMVGMDSTTDTTVGNGNGVELLSPSAGVFVYNKKVFVTDSLSGDSITRYAVKDGSFVKEAKLSTGQNVQPGSIIWVNDTKAYVTTYQTGELLVINPQDMTITKRMDLSDYALGEGDTNPEPSSGVIRDGKLFLGLFQVDNFTSVKCQGGASVLIIDAATDEVEKHLQDDRTCSSGMLEPNKGLYLDEVGDIYVPNIAGYGYYPGTNSGFLRIRNGAEEFDPDYYFSVSDLTITGVPGEKASYPYQGIYAADGILYSNLYLPGLSSNPPDYVKDKNYKLFKLDLRNQTATAIDVPNTAGWAADMSIKDGKLLLGRLANAGQGLFWYDPSDGTLKGDQTPSITTAGSPHVVVDF